ncbi:MAG: hormogonium polysaccharide biosynthesis protein HpsA [Microcoleus anatoxicus]|uniref:hormogonium polysaccharide biosynthesis protein HpsA n=1 Tax=Microcoleus anatoxicus TaxID=2705319 RepID=UPI003670908C
MYKSKLSKVIVSLLRRVLGVTRSGAKRLMRAMLRSLMAMGRRANLPVAGFVLPTVTMVLLVVILLTVAITLRSFDRANNARNVRVNQQVLAAATPAIDRAKAKIQFLLQQTQGRGTPSDRDLYFLIANPTTSGSPTDRYTFGDETRLRIKYDLDDSKSISPDLRVNDTGFVVEKNESINTAWRYPVDTNNDGKFDNFTLYGIFFRNPPRDDDAKSPTVGDFLRQRKPLEARTPPVVQLKAGCTQGGGTVATLAGDSGWYRIDGKLKKSFFVYTVNVPMTAKDAAIDPNKYQAFTGTSSISALEYQQDQSLIPIANNAVVYENDLDISPGPPLRLNGRVFTNSNLLVSGAGSANSIQFYQVSSPDSCYYEQENSKIVVSGNVVNGTATNNTTKNAVDVHLFKKEGGTLPAGGRTSFMLGQKSEIKNPTGESASNPTLEVLYNDEAYTKRLDLLVAAQMGAPLPATGLANPDVQPSDPFSVRQKPETQSREQALGEYFKQMLRKVPFAEVLPGGDATAGYGLTWSVPPGTPPMVGTQDTLRPIDDWTNLAKTNISLTANQLEATDPSKEPEEERFLGDRLVAGNNLPALRWDATKSEFTKEPEKLIGQKWNKTDAVDPNFPRTRSPHVTKIADVGATDRGGFWEGAAAEIPKNPLDGVGGLRVITSAGVYERKNSFLPPPTWIDSTTGNPATTATYNDPATPANEQFPVVWPDSMPMSPLGEGSKVYDNSAGGAFNDANWTKWVNSWSTNLPPAVGSSLIDPSTPQYAKGDLRMRATAVYHYADNGYDPTKLTAGNQPDQTPIACISSYYDPSTASTARNLSTLPAGTDVSGDTSLGARGSQIGSNNGITYGPPTRGRPAISTLNTTTGLLSGGDTILEAQANMVFPDGRFANGPLRKALVLAEDKRTLADKAAIDSTNCALQILDGSIGAANQGVIAHGAIKEVAFLNGREIKAIDRDDLTTNVNEAFTLSSPATGAQAAKLTGYYNLPLEERQPLEIRATQIDLDQLRKKMIAQSNKTGPTPEYLLPDSGIIYASRDDALRDLSFRPGLATGGIDETRSKTVSPTDSLLDPTRKPNGILLINGQQLARDSGDPATVADVVKEKGLTLASNLPVYVQGDFNPHLNEEFNQKVGDWSTFYDRKSTDLNNNFACRPKDPRLNGKCTTGDTWRPANIVSDSVNLLSTNYRFGFRNEGDFDLRNNAGAAAVIPRKQQGFYSNNFVTNGLSSGAFSSNGYLVSTTGATATPLIDSTYVSLNPPLSSSYFNNFVTPVQRRGNFPEYLMEVCTKIPVSACGDDDWYVNPLAGAPGKATTTVGQPYAKPIDNTSTFQAGSTVDPPLPALQRFPRRVAFSRTANALDSLTAPEPLGIDTTNGKVVKGPGRSRDNSLWFATTVNAGDSTVTYNSNFPYVFNQAQKDGSGANLPQLDTAIAPGKGTQPLLMPVLQIQNVTAADSTEPTGVDIVIKTGWIPQANNTTFNMVVGSNDSPSRALGNGVGDFNGGMQNLPRFMESWNSGQVSTNIQGSFIQFGRSEFSTAPYIPVIDPGAMSALAAQAVPATTANSIQLRSLFDSPPTDPPDATSPKPFYRTDNANLAGKGGRIPFFSPPARNWGYDLGLLSQPPDLFTRKFTTPPSKRTPDEYFREVSRDDEWVQTLLCSFIDDATTATTPAIDITNKLRPTDSFCKFKAGA